MGEILSEVPTYTNCAFLYFTGSSRIPKVWTRQSKVKMAKVCTDYYNLKKHQFIDVRYTYLNHYTRYTRLNPVPNNRV